MTEKIPPAFQFYASDFVGGTMSFSAEQSGAYILLLCYQWMNGQIPQDDDELCRIGRCSSTALAVVKRKFKITTIEGGLQNRKLEEVRDAQMEYRRKQAENGKKGGLNSKHRSSTAQAPLEFGLSVGQALQSPSPSPSPIPTQTPPPVSEKTVGKTPALTDDQWLESLSKNETYSGLDVRREYGKMCAWCSTNQKQPSRKRFVNWLNRADKPMSVNGHSTQPLTPYAIKTIIQAKETRAAEIKVRFCSDTAIDQVWSNDTKRREFFELKKEIRNLNDQLSKMA